MAGSRPNGRSTQQATGRKWKFGLGAASASVLRWLPSASHGPAAEAAPTLPAGSAPGRREAANMSQLTAASGAESGHSMQDKHFWALALGSIGVVYGDIGTSPLYALKEAVKAATEHGATGHDAVLGILSLMTWTLLLIVTLKYVLILLNADNKGEGGPFALMALGQSVAKRSAPLILALGVAGAAFFYGDAVITPAISVLSAVEGLKLVAGRPEGAAAHQVDF